MNAVEFLGLAKQEGFFLFEVVDQFILGKLEQLFDSVAHSLLVGPQFVETILLEKALFPQCEQPTSARSTKSAKVEEAEDRMLSCLLRQNGESVNESNLRQYLGGTRRTVEVGSQNGQDLFGRTTETTGEGKWLIAGFQTTASGFLQMSHHQFSSCKLNDLEIFDLRMSKALVSQPGAQGKTPAVDPQARPFENLIEQGEQADDSH